MTSFTVEHRTVTVWPGREPGGPVIYLNTYGQEGRQVWEELEKRDLPSFSLAAVSDLDWNRDLSPWEAPAIRREEEPFGGGAPVYLDCLTQKILPAVEELLPGGVAWRGIAGYSMAGLFAVWALSRTADFQRCASMSGSLWFPGVREYLVSHLPPEAPACIYFSLGSRESKTRNPLLRTVEEDTRALEAFYRGRGIDTVFQLNPGNHFQGSTARTAAGIAWMLGR